MSDRSNPKVSALAAEQAETAFQAKPQSLIDGSSLTQQSQMRFMLTSVVASSIANMAGYITGHPLDTIKVRLQTETRNITARQCLYETIQNEGTLSLYKGLSQPLIGAVPANTILFYMTDYSKAALVERWPSMSVPNQSLLAGSIAGFASLSIFVPLELLKCRAQVQKQGEIRYGQMIHDLYRMQGVTGLYRGFWAMAWRDIPGWGVYFAAYEKLKEVGNQMGETWSCNEEQRAFRQFLWTLNAGGVAGALSWFICIPWDVIKARQQTHLGDQPLSMSEVYSTLMREGGYRSIWTGINPILVRAYFVNLVTLPMYDAIKEKLDEY